MTHDDKCIDRQTCQGMIESRDRIIHEQARQLTDKDKELQARREILDVLSKTMGADGNCWLAAAELDWRLRLREFASDNEQHEMSRDGWTLDRHVGVTLYAHGGFFTAYYEDAAELWGQADDTLPMYHVMTSGTPHRTCIHPLHLVAWVEHFAEIYLPVQIMKKADDE